MAEAKAVKFSTQGDYKQERLAVASIARDDPSPLHTHDGRRYTLRLKLHRFDLSLYLLQTCFYNMSITNRPSEVLASACM